MMETNCYEARNILLWTEYAHAFGAGIKQILSACPFLAETKIPEFHIIAFSINSNNVTLQSNFRSHRAHFCGWKEQSAPQIPR